MPTFHLPAAILAGLLLATAAHAQNTLVEVNNAANVPMLSLSADAAEDMAVMGPGGSKIGEVDEVVGNSADVPSALVIDFESGNNYPDRDVAIPLDQFTMASGGLTLNTKPADLSAYPEYKD